MGILKSIGKILGGIMIAGGGLALSLLGVKKISEGSDDLTTSIAQSMAPDDEAEEADSAE